MHWQRIVFTGATLAIASTIILPWTSEAIDDGKVVLTGYETPWIQAACALAVIAAAASFLGNRVQRVSVVTWMVVFAMALFSLTVSVAIYTYVTFKLFDGTAQILVAEMIWSDYGVFVTGFASIVILATAIFSPFLGRRASTETNSNTAITAESNATEPTPKTASTEPSDDEPKDAQS